MMSVCKGCEGDFGFLKTYWLGPVLEAGGWPFSPPAMDGRFPATCLSLSNKWFIWSVIYDRNALNYFSTKHQIDLHQIVNWLLLPGYEDFKEVNGPCGTCITGIDPPPTPPWPPIPQISPNIRLTASLALKTRYTASPCVFFASRTNLSFGHVAGSAQQVANRSSRNCPSAPGICPHICPGVAHSQGSYPRRDSPLTALAFMSKVEAHPVLPTESSSSNYSGFRLKLHKPSIVLLYCISLSSYCLLFFTNL